MKKIIDLIFNIFGMPLIIRVLFQRNRTTILMYHDINPIIFEHHLVYLKKRYNIISLQEYLDAREKKLILPKYSLVIVFDDGHIGNYKLLPIFQKYSIHPTIFLTSGLVNTRRNYWFLTELDLDTLEKLKHIPNEDRLRKLKEINGFNNTKEYEQYFSLTKSMILEMNEFVDFQSHTKFHPILNKCSDSELEYELQESKSALSSLLKKEVSVIAYPNGDYDDRVILRAKECGYKYGLTVDYGFNSINQDSFKLKRLSATDNSSILELTTRVTGIWWYLKKKVLKYGRK